MSPSHGKSPWTTVEHDGYRWMVRHMVEASWLVRLPNREVFLLDPADVPQWARAAPAQLELRA